jgi:hypothetical protein
MFQVMNTGNFTQIKWMRVQLEPYSTTNWTSICHVSSFMMEVDTTAAYCGAKYAQTAI